MTLGVESEIQLLRWRPAHGGIALLMALLARPAGAEPAEIRALGSGTLCPSASAVRAQIDRLASQDRQRKIPPGSLVELDDRGTSLKISVQVGERNDQREFADPRRDCLRRARFAAVFAALTLMPLEVADEEPAPAEVPSAPPVGPQSARPPVRPKAAKPNSVNPIPPKLGPQVPPPSVREGQNRAFWVDVRGTAQLAPSMPGYAQGTSGSGEIRAAWGSQHWKALGGLGFSPSARLSLGAYSFQLERFPVDIGVRKAWPLAGVVSGVQILGEFSGVAVFERFEGTGFLKNTRGLALDLGLRLAVLLGIPWHERWMVFAGLSTLLALTPRGVSSLPRGDLGKLPLVQPGVVLGFAAGF